MRLGGSVPYVLQQSGGHGSNYNQPAAKTISETGGELLERERERERKRESNTYYRTKTTPALTARSSVSSLTCSNNTTINTDAA